MDWSNLKFRPILDENAEFPIQSGVQSKTKGLFWIGVRIKVGNFLVMVMVITGKTVLPRYR